MNFKCILEGLNIFSNRNLNVDTKLEHEYAMGKISQL